MASSLDVINNILYPIWYELYIFMTFDQLNKEYKHFCQKSQELLDNPQAHGCTIESDEWEMTCNVCVMVNAERTFIACVMNEKLQQNQ